MTISLVQTDAATTTGTLGLAELAITTTAGSTLVAVVAAHAQAASWTVSSVFDDAGNNWTRLVSRHAGSATSTTQPLLAVWTVANAAAVTRVRASVGGAWSLSGTALRVYEVSGLTNVSALDVVGSTVGNVSSITPTATTTHAADFLLAACATAAASVSVSHTADAWTTAAEAFVDGGSESGNTIRLNAAHQIVSAAGAQSTTWTAGSTTDMAAVLIALKGGTTDTSNPNPYWPQLATEAAFGTQPNAGSAISYGTDLSTYVRSFTANFGAPYELGTAAAGTNEMELYNDDGRFDPTNAASPYWPNVLDYTPMQQTATWDGVTYGVFTGFVERWPLEWDDVLTGVSKAVGVDTWAALARVELKTCMQHEVLLDGPWAYWPLNDPQDSAFAANLAAGSGSAVLLYPVPPRRTGPGTAAFGVSTTLAGDPNTGWGQDGNAEAKDDAGWTMGTGVIPGSTFPSIASGGSVTVEAWAAYPLRPQKKFLSTLFALKSSAASWSGHEILALQVNQQSSSSDGRTYVSTTGNLYVKTWNASGVATTVDTGRRCYADGRWHHFAVTYSASSVSVYVDGALVYSASPSIATDQVDLIDLGGSQDAWDGSTIGTGSYAHVAVHGTALTPARLLSHYRSGHDGFPEDAGSRVARILTYAGWKGAMAVEKGSTVLAACSTIGGQKLTDALADIEKWELGLVFVDSLGRAVFRSRGSRFNETSRGTFGDGTGEYHYAADIAFDYDPTYQYNDIRVTRTGPHGTTGVTQVSGDPSATIPQYFTSTLSLDAAVLSDAEAQDRASFLYSLYAVPQLRVRSVTITPSADPTLWPIALGARIGDVYTVVRRPLGAGNAITLTVMITEVKHTVAPGSWATAFTMIPAGVSPRGANILPYNVQSIETDASGWEAGGNTTIAQSTAQAKDGTHSLAMTATAAGGIGAVTAVWYAVRPSAPYTFSCWLYSATATTGGIGVDWRDVAGTYLSTDQTTTPLAAGVWTYIELSATAPLTAYNVTPVVGYGMSLSAGQTVYGDVFTLTGVVGSSGPWRLGDSAYSVLGTSTIPAF